MIEKNEMEYLEQIQVKKKSEDEIKDEEIDSLK